MFAFWNSTRMKEESVMLVSYKGAAPCGTLLFPPTKVHKLVSYSFAFGERIWQEGKDYVVSGSVIHVLNKDMPYMTEEELAGEVQLEGLDYSSIPSITSGLFLPFTEGTQLLYRQVLVTYQHDAIWKYAIPAYAGHKLTRSILKLEQKEELRLFIYGDSISVGANSTGHLKVPPYRPTWYELVVYGLWEYYGTKVSVENQSVGGWTSNNAISSSETIGWIRGKQIKQAGLKVTLAKMPDYRPDLVILGFGMNDATHKLSQEVYHKNMTELIHVLREQHSKCEIILVGTMLANPMAKEQSMNQLSYYKILKEIADHNEGIVSVNVGQMHQDMLKAGKKYIDLTSNNVNHPNDYMASIYAMNIMSLLIDEHNEVQNERHYI